MNTPGVSIFQGAESIKVNTTLERQEEEEMLEDQKRRQMELGDLLENAFDDLDDNESTIDSTSNFRSDLLPAQNDHPIYHQLPTPPTQTNNIQHHQHHQQQQHQQQQHSGNVHAGCEMEIHKLKMIVESRGHELEHIKQLTTEEHKKCDELQKRLSITEAELERALNEKNNTHELLVDSKEKCSNLDNVISKLRNERKLLESENSSLSGKLETAQSLLSELQQKYDMVERDFLKRDDRNAELRIRQLEERQRAQIDLLEQQMNNLADQLAKKTQEVETLSARYNALQSSHETLLVDKATKINELNNALGEAQRKCSELLAKPNYEGECHRLQNAISSYQTQIAGMEKTIATLNERLSCTTAELDLMDSVLHQCNQDDTPRRLSQTQGKVVGSTPLNTVDRIGQIKDELYRALSNVKSKRDEVRKLQQTLEDRNEQIRALREEENKSLVQLTTLKEDKIRLENRIKVLEEELDAADTKNKTLDNSKVMILKQELEDLRQERDLLQKQCNELTQARECQDDERRKIDVQLKNVEVDLEELKQERESMKRNYEKIMHDNRQLRARTTEDGVRLELERHKILLKDAQSECDRLKKLYTSITNDKELLSYELEKLRGMDNQKELGEQREKVSYLQRTLQLAELKASELSKILETEKLSHERELKTLRERLEKEKLEQAKEARENPGDCNKCIEHMAEITKFEIETLKLNNLNTNHKKEIEELNIELKHAKDHLAELHEKLKLAEKQDYLIAELKKKAIHFEEYIKAHSSMSEQSSHVSPKVEKQVNTIDKSTTTASPLNSSPEVPQAYIKKIEARIRDEMAQIFATELKRFQLKLQQTEEKSVCLQREYQHVCNDLQQRQNEVELLKQAILAEREKIEEILGKKDIECKEIMQKQKVILHKCRDELHAKNERIVELSKELQERQTQIEAERQSMKAVMAQWEEQRKSIDHVEQEWRTKLKELRLTHEEAVRAMEAKYKSAKRTAANYKRYAEDKEAHMLREYDRIKHEYDMSLTKMEVRINETLERRNREITAKMNSPNQKAQAPSQNKENLPSN